MTAFDSKVRKAILYLGGDPVSNIIKKLFYLKIFQVKQVNLPTVVVHWDPASHMALHGSITGIIEDLKEIRGTFIVI